MTSDQPPQLPTIRTPRTVLRDWTAADREPFIALAGNPEVRRYFPNVATREQAEAMLERIQTRARELGYSFWVLEIPEVGPMVGIVGVQPVDFMDGQPLEIGWWLHPDAWHRGYATESARAIRDYAFTTIGIDHLVSVTATQNLPSQRVMQRLGMTTNPAENFPHPRVPVDSHLLEHVLYRLSRDQWLARLAEEGR